MTRDLPASLHASLAAYRYDVFVKRLCWQLPAAPGHEQDQFDHADTLHVMASNDAGEIVGYGRLLPCDGPYLLESVFPQLLNGMPAPRGPKVWELSRFAAMDVQGTTRPTARGEYLAERVLLEALRCCASNGVDTLLAVSTLAVERLIRRAGVSVQRFGPPCHVADQWILGFAIAVDERSLAALESFEAAAGARASRLPPLRAPTPETLSLRQGSRLSSAGSAAVAA